MQLYEDKDLFHQTISATAQYSGLIPSIIEKDYFVTLFLKQLALKIPNLLFKGGTSLSKCYKVINRFSEDIDITLSSPKITQGQKKELKNIIKEICSSFGFILLNENETRSRRDYNRYEIDYSPESYDPSINPRLIVETSYIVKSYPADTKPASSMIYDYMTSINQLDFINQYELSPFLINVQTMERTLIDKIFALCDYYLTDNVSGHSRHIYDINQLIKYVKLDDNFVTLFDEVRTDRQSSKSSQCVSASSEQSITALLTEIIEYDVYKKDYDKVTANILFDKIPYNEAIIGIRTLISSKLLG